MTAFAFGPGSAVLISGPVIFYVARVGPLNVPTLAARSARRFAADQASTLRVGDPVGARLRPEALNAGRSGRWSLALPSRSGCCVFKKDAARVELFANSIRFGEVTRPASGAPRLNQLLDLPDRNRRALLFMAPQRQDAEHAIEPLERVAHRRRVAGAQLPRVDGRVERAHQIEDDAERRGGIQIGADVIGERRGRLFQPGRRRRARAAGWQGVEAGEKIGETLQRLFRLAHRAPGKLEL